MTKRFILFISLLCIILSPQLFAQSYGGISLVSTSPTNAYLSGDYSPGSGISFDLISQDIFAERLINLQYGLHTDFMRSGSTGFYGLFSGENLDIQIRNQSIGAYAFGRLITKKSVLRFYTEVFAGSRLLYTKLYDNKNDEEDWITSNSNLFCGIGAGMQIRIKEGLFADVNVAQTMGGPARLVDLNSFDPIDNFTSYSTYRVSDVNNLQLQVGIVYQMGWTVFPSPKEKHKQAKNKHKKEPKPVKERKAQPPVDKKAPEPLIKG